MIELGLTRTFKLLTRTSFKWRAVHVAGTNGKGSVCAYTSAILHAHGMKIGRFTSPHLLARHDCITIAERTVSRSHFLKAESQIMRKNSAEDIRASEFEILTATAFELFEQAGLDFAVVEVGVGGRLDATNVLNAPVATVITRIGKDHEALLGSTLETIALQKAGIMKPDIPCLIDGSNDASIIEVIKTYAGEVAAGPRYVIPNDMSAVDSGLLDSIQRPSVVTSQRMNMDLAIGASHLALRAKQIRLDPERTTQALRSVEWPGRLQVLLPKGLTNHKGILVLDGAHNPLAAETLRQFLDTKLAVHRTPIIWTVAFSDTKDPRGIMKKLVHPADHVIATDFGHVDGMPWVTAMNTSDVLTSLAGLVDSTHLHSVPDNVSKALVLAGQLAGDKPVVIAGSLYLAADVLRLVTADTA